MARQVIAVRDLAMRLYVCMYVCIYIYPSQSTIVDCHDQLRNRQDGAAD